MTSETQSLLLKSISKRLVAELKYRANLAGKTLQDYVTELLNKAVTK